MPLTYSEIDFNNTDKKKKRKNVTLKNAKKPHEKIKIPQNSYNLGQHFLNNEGSDNDDNLAEFDSHNEQRVDMPPPPQITNFPSPDKNENQKLAYDPNISPYSANQTNSNSSYYEHFVPNFKKLANAQGVSGDSELMTKLNHILHLLEEQKDSKTSNVTEELILYLFLGVFVIFTVDSFTKVGKYTR